MKIKRYIAIAAIAACAAPVLANTSTVAITAGTPTYYFAPSLIFGSFQDTITFEGLSAGKYNVQLGLVGSGIDISSITLNGESPISSFVTTGFSVYAFTSNIFSPFKLDIAGSKSSAGLFGLYSGSLSAVAAVPEPETYALALTALGLGFFVRRKSRKESQTPVLAG